MLLFLFVPISPHDHPKSNPYAGYVRHFVAWKFLSTVSNDTKAEVMQRYTSLQYKCVNETTGNYHHTTTTTYSYRWVYISNTLATAAGPYVFSFDHQQASLLTSCIPLFVVCFVYSGLPYIVEFDAGFPNSPEGFDQGMEQGTYLGCILWSYQLILTILYLSPYLSNLSSQSLI